MGLEPVELVVRIGVASVSGRHARVQMQKEVEMVGPGSMWGIKRQKAMLVMLASCKYRQRTQKDLHALARQSPVNCVLHGDCKPHAHIPNTSGASMLPSVSDMSISATV